MKLAKKGLQLTKKAIEQIKDALPFPGKEAASLALVVLNLVDTAMANADNLQQLQERALAFLDILDAYHTTLLQVQKYKGVVDEYSRLLEGICKYAQTYTNRNCVMKLLTGSDDREHYEELLAGLADLTQRVMLSVGFDSNARLQGVQAAVAEAVEALQRVSVYTDHAERVRSAVQAAGGLEAVMVDPAKLQAVLEQMEDGQRITVEAVRLLLASHLDRGPHCKIRQPDLQLFWKLTYPGEASVPWAMFWSDFPAGLARVCSAPSAASATADASTTSVTTPAASGGGSGSTLAQRMVRLLATKTARAAFQRAVELEDNARVSVYELHLAFSGAGDLEDEARSLLERVAGRGGLDGLAEGAFTWEPAAAPATDTAAWPGGSIPAAGGGGDGDDGGGGGGGNGGSSPAKTFSATRMQLPQVDPKYVGREEAACDVVDVLIRGGSSALLLAGGGMGKSSLAIDVGWRLFSAGSLPAGVLWVDLRGARSSVEVEARFCSTLGMQREQEDNVGRIVVAISKAADGGIAAGDQASKPGSLSLLLVVDNAEDALSDGAAAGTLHGMLSHITRAAGPSVRMLVTSRVPLGAEVAKLVEVRVSELGPQAASRFVRSIAQDVTPKQAATVAAACGCVPLVLRLVSEALVRGQLTLKDMPTVASCSGGPTAPAAAASGAAEYTVSATPNAAAPADAMGVSAPASASAAMELSSSGPPPPYPVAVAVEIVLRSLTWPLQRAVMQLAVFPAAFSSGDAAAVMATSQQQAASTLAALYRQGLLQNSARRSSAAPFIMHASIRQAAEQLAARADPTTQPAARVRYARLVLQLLGEWAGMYRSREYRLALKLARDRQPDIGHLVELISPQPPPQPPLLPPQPSQQVRQVLSADCASPPADASAAGFGGTDAAAGAAAAVRCGSACGGGGGDGGGGGGGEGLLAVLWRDMAAALTNELFLLLDAMGVLTVLEPACIALAGEAEGGCGSVGRGGGGAVVGRLDAGAPLLLSNVHFFLAHIKRVRGRYADAEGYARACVDVRVQELGEDSPEAGKAMYCLGWCLRSHGHDEEIRPLYEKFVQACRRYLGEDHPDTAQSLHGLAICMGALKHFQEAVQLFSRAVELRQRLLGAEHPDVMHSLNGLATCHAEHREWPQAEPLFRRLLDMRMRVQGEEHSETAAALKSLALCVKRQDRLTEAEALNRRALDLHTRVHGEGHPKTAACMFNLAACVEAQGGREAEAEPLYRRALAANRQALGEEHAYTAATLENLAGCVQDQGRIEEARELWKELVEIRRRTLGLGHEETLDAEESLKECV
ncbi:hypothetical protein GPECTOR_75g744 [Gonium pectorale]|uniref:Uncharacterized protein n=1 Tax=Gonium pectorale TaxID=33097 RepID=A0A150G3Z7_GONPE|nr:hypothetical protein GPECTOR_75g744 [Gonium pectorale]|eukprot:KXZ44020.1 hypothetical protein GPECTOR_75g744 [Gonium pectorale]